MGASIKIQDINLNITKLECSQCQQKFTDKDKETNNWDLWFDTTGDDVHCLKIGGWWRLGAWVRDITHQFSSGEVNGKPWHSYDCPEPQEQAKEVNHA